MNGVDYQPQTASPNKKHAKAMAATVALQALGEVILKKRMQTVVKYLQHRGNIIIYYFISTVLSLFGYSPCNQVHKSKI